MQSVLLIIFLILIPNYTDSHGTAGLQLIDPTGRYGFDGTDEQFHLVFESAVSTGTLNIKYTAEDASYPFAIVDADPGTFEILLAANLSTNCSSGSLVQVRDLQTNATIINHNLTDSGGFIPFTLTANYSTKGKPYFSTYLITQGEGPCAIHLGRVTLSIVTGALPGSLGSSITAIGAADLLGPGTVTMNFYSSTITGSSFSTTGSSEITGYSVGQVGAVTIDYGGKIPTCGQGHSYTLTLYRNSLALKAYTSYTNDETFSYYFTDYPSVGDRYTIVLSSDCAVAATGHLVIEQLISNFA